MPKLFMIYHILFIWELDHLRLQSICLFVVFHLVSIVYKYMVMDFFSILKQLDELLGESLAEVDWRKSFYLNMIAHTSFTVTVAICR